ncbi:NAD(P)/FAD-dependent oxidoreductase [Candidatus Berkelbacteria bacterium]|nr:NAD(P)/FAD-dependent oxidoreductase [Candidatus Berkelbacteria bacterium]
MDRGNSDAFDVVVIGAGSAGLAVARPVAAAGQRVALVERDQWLGGECPNYACIPTKALLRSSNVYRLANHADQFGLSVGDVNADFALLRAHRESVVRRTNGHTLTPAALAKDGITVVRGEARFVSTNTLTVGPSRGGEAEAGKQTISGRQFVIASGVVPSIPPIPGLDRVPYLTSRSFMALTELPDSVIILGGGPIGVEFAQILATFGVDVTLLEGLPQLLPREEPEVAAVLAASLEGYGVEVHAGVTVDRVSGDREGVTVDASGAEGTVRYSANRLFLATGTRPNVDHLNLEAVEVKVGNHGITTDEHLRTSTPHIWAAGDVTGHLGLTHIAHYEGALVAHNILHREQQALDLRVAPRTVFTHVELASVGQTERELREAKREIVVGLGQVAPLGRALTDDEPEGVVKVVADAQTGEVLGGSIACVRAGEMIHELALAMQARLSVERIAETIHAFPTYSEAVLVAAADAVAQLEG